MVRVTLARVFSILKLSCLCRVAVGWSPSSYMEMVGGDVVIGRWDLPTAVAVSEYSMTSTILWIASVVCCAVTYVCVCVFVLVRQVDEWHLAILESVCDVTDTVIQWGRHSDDIFEAIGASRGLCHNGESVCLLAMGATVVIEVFVCCCCAATVHDGPYDSHLGVWRVRARGTPYCCKPSCACELSDCACVCVCRLSSGQQSSANTLAVARIGACTAVSCVFAVDEHSCLSHFSYRVNFFTCEVTDVSVEPLRVAHAVLMSLSWGIMLPLGVFTAMFLRKVPPLSGPGAFWFVWHKRLQVWGLGFAIIGFVLALVMVKGNHWAIVHSKLGLGVMVAGLSQPLNALIRPKPTEKWRWVWNILHKSTGYGAILLGIVTIFLGCQALGVTSASLAGLGNLIAFCLLATLLVVVFVWTKYFRSSITTSATELPTNSDKAFPEISAGEIPEGAPSQSDSHHLLPVTHAPKKCVSVLC